MDFNEEEFDDEYLFAYILWWYSNYFIGIIYQILRCDNFLDVLLINYDLYCLFIDLNS